MIDLSKEYPMSIADVAGICKVHRRTVESWFLAGLEKAKIGGRVYTTREALQRFAQIEDQEQVTKKKFDAAMRRENRLAEAKVKRQLGIT